MRPEASPPLPVLRAADLDEPDQDGHWLVETLWPRAGVGIIGGAPKCGKSWLGQRRTRPTPTPGGEPRISVSDTNSNNFLRY